MKKIYKTDNGFTLIELLAVIVVIGILLGISIAAVMHFIDRARTEQIASQEKTLTIAAKNYLQENRGLLPKSIGETTRIDAKILKDNKYLTEDIKNSKKESCMFNSFVEAKKESQTKYVYKAYIYCGGESHPNSNAASTPTIQIDFVDASGRSIKNDASIAEKVSEAKFIIDFSGGTRDGKKIGIDGYSYSVLVKIGTETGFREVYSSGTLSANRSPDIHVDRDNNLADYIDITTETTVAIRATVRNLDGGVSDIIEFIGDGSEQAEVVYKDNVKPVCVAGQTIGEAANNDWINISTPNRERKITVVCKDGSGSGCIRSTFTKTWNGSEAYEYDTIQIKDNAGNVEECRVRVNVDKIYPVISLDAYAMSRSGREDGTKIGDSILTGTKTTANSANASVTINSNEYKNLYSGYMNKAKYPNGVIYKVKFSDSVALKNWKWEVNDPEITSTSDPAYETVSLNSSEAKVGSCTDDKECSIYVYFFDNGLRKGVLTLYDKAGNKASYTIYANVNRITPEAPTIVNSSSGDSTGAWTRSSVTLDLSSRSTAVPLGDYYYSYNIDAEEFSTNDSDADTKWVKLYGGTGQTSFTTMPWDVEINKKTYVIACDQAENCSDLSSTMIMIDRTAPTGIKVKGYKKENSENISSVDGLNLETINSNTWHSGWVIVIPSNATDSGSGGIHYLVTVTGASENVLDADQNYRNVNAEGVSTVSFKACDQLDNCSATSSFIVKLDRTGPTRPTISNSTGGNWTKSNVTLTIGSSDSNTEVSKYYYSYDSSPSGTGTNPKTQWVEMTEGANKTSFTKTWSSDINENVYIKACDQLNNCSAVNHTAVRIDTVAPARPTITNPTNGEWTNKNFSLSLESNDAGGSGLADYQYTYNENASTVGDDADTQWKSNGKLATESYTTTEFSIERDQNVYWRVCDALDNCSAVSSTRIRLDKTKPTCGEITTTTNESEDGVSGSITCTDDDSHCVSNSYSFGPLTSTDTVELEDHAGNIKECPITITSYDCSSYAVWQFFSIYSNNNNNCPADTESWDYEYGTCSTDYHYDVCQAKCDPKCSPYSSSCKYVCCVKRRRSGKQCYKH